MRSRPFDSVCVVTFAYRRPELLSRCIASVARQQTELSIRQLVMLQEETRIELTLSGGRSRYLLEWRRQERFYEQAFASGRLARMRQDVLELIDEPLVCFLDDDNEFLDGHLQSLLSLIREDGLDAAFSWRRLVSRDGRPYDGFSYPWHPEPDRANALHRWCVEHGVIEPGSDIVRDGPRDDRSAENVATVDMNEWMIGTDLLRSVGFDTYFSQEDARNQIGEDDKLLGRFMSRGVRFGCTARATVLYRLGGVSNCVDDGEKCES